MKKKVILFLAAVSVAVVSCKKETQDALNNKSFASFTRFDPSQIEDMDAYLKDFKQKMQESKGDETLSLGDAAWFLSSLANRDFGHVCAGYTGFYYDTIYGHVNVTNGEISLADLNTAYTQISTDIEKFYNDLALNNKHFRFIDAIISRDGSVTIPMFITYNQTSRYLDDTIWYFPNINYADSVGEIYFDKYTLYFWEDTTMNGAIGALKYALNTQLSLLSIPMEKRPYFTYSRTEEPFFIHANCIDPFGSPFGFSSRIYNAAYYNRALDYETMLYAFDSYLDVGNSLIPDHLLEAIIDWDIKTFDTIFPHDHFTYWYHQPIIRYGNLSLYDPSVD